MKIADVTVGTEYAAVYHQSRNETERSLVERAHRVVVRSIGKGGKVRVSRAVGETHTFFDTTNETSARNLVMPWADAVPMRKEIREDRIKRAQRGAEQAAREQAALRAVGEFLENHDALGMTGLPYTLKGAIALANGDPGVTTQGTLTYARNRHEPKVEVNVVTLLALLRMAYDDGFNADGNGDGKETWAVSL